MKPAAGSLSVMSTDTLRTTPSTTQPETETAVFTEGLVKIFGDNRAGSC